jgi:glutaredoxin
MGLRVALAAVLASVLALAAATASAQIYRWTDEKGRVHITDTPPPASARNVQKQKAVGNIAVPAQTPHELTQAVKSFPVTLYTSPACKEACASARTALNQRGVPFNEVQVWDEQTNAQLKQVSGRNDVPTLVVGRSVQVGFEQGAFDALLDSARYPKAGAVPPGSQVTPEPPEGYTPQPRAAQPVQPEPEAPAPAGPYAPKAPLPARQ